MKAILIDPFTQTVTEVEISKDYTEIYTFIEADTFDVVGLDNGDGVYIDDVGLFRDNNAFFMIGNYPQPLAGKGLILGSDEEGESQDVICTLAEVMESIKFMSVLDVFVWSRTNGF